MSNGEIRARQFWLDKALVNFICLIKLVRKCFMCRLGKHAEKKTLLTRIEKPIGLRQED
jgi:hypothetical protein